MFLAGEKRSEIMDELINNNSGSNEGIANGRFLAFEVGKEIYRIEKITEEIGRSNGIYVFL